MNITRPIWKLVSLLAAAASASSAMLASELPKNGVILTVRPVSMEETRTTRWKTEYGSFDKVSEKSIFLKVSARRTVQGNPNVSIEWYFMARDAETRKPSVFDSARIDVSLPESATHEFGVSSATVRNRDTKYSALGIRERNGEKLWGWVVLVRSGQTIIASEGSLYEVRQWLLDAIERGEIGRPPIARPTKQDLNR